MTDSARGVQSYRWVDNDTIIFSAQEDPALYEQELKQKKDSSRVVDDVAHEPPVRLYRLSVKDRKITRLTDNTDFIQSWDVTPDGKHALTVHAQYLSFEWDQKILPKTFVYDLADGRAAGDPRRGAHPARGRRERPGRERLLFRGAVLDRPEVLHRLGPARLLPRPGLGPDGQGRPRLGERPGRRPAGDA